MLVFFYYGWIKCINNQMTLDIRMDEPIAGKTRQSYSSDCMT